MINPQPVYNNKSPYSSSSSFPSGERPVLPPSSPAPKPTKKRWKRVVLLLFVGLLVGGITFAASTYISLRNNIIVADDSTKDAAILNYDPSNKGSNLDVEKFTHLGDGRFNMVLVGVDKAAGLTDSIQVLSIDTINKKSSITSIPRDLYVTVPGYGRSKINAAYKISEGKKAGSGSAVLKQVVGSVLGTTVTNYALIDFSGLEELVDSLGGIEVNVPKAISDPLFPASSGEGYAPFTIKAGLQKMNGKTALSYARSRQTTSDFDRSARQQIVIEAIQKKALSAGVLTNPVKITNILQALGRSFKTDLQIDQVRTLLSIYSGVPDDQKKTFVLDTSTELGLLTSSSGTPAGYINYPILGFDHYTSINRWHRKNNPDPLLAKESPTITIANGGKATEKQMTELAETLKDYGYAVTVDKNYSSKNKVTATQVYEAKSDEKPFTANYLSTQFGTSLQKGSPLAGATDFDLIYIPSNATPTPSPTIAPTSD